MDAESAISGNYCQANDTAETFYAAIAAAEEAYGDICAEYASDAERGA